MCSLYLYESVERAITRAFLSHQEGKSYSTFHAAGVWSCCNAMIRSFISLLAEWALTDAYHTEISFVFGHQSSPSGTQFTQRSLKNNPKWSLLLGLISLNFWRRAASCHHRVSRPAWSDFKGLKTWRTHYHLDIISAITRAASVWSSGSAAKCRILWWKSCFFMGAAFGCCKLMFMELWFELKRLSDLSDLTR